MLQFLAYYPLATVEISLKDLQAVVEVVERLVQLAYFAEEEVEALI
jgi:DNA-binding SARP family transcriptional activator